MLKNLNLSKRIAPFLIFFISGITLGLNLNSMLESNILLIFYILISLIVIFISLYLTKSKIKTLFFIIIFLIGFLKAYLTEKNFFDVLSNISGKKIIITGWLYSKEKNINNYFTNINYILINKIFVSEENKRQIISCNYILKINTPKINNINEYAIGSYIKLKDINIKNTENKKREAYRRLISQNIIYNLFESKNNIKIKKLDCKIEYNLNYIIKLIKIKIAIIREKIIKKITNKINGLTKLLFEYIFLGIKNNNDLTQKIRIYMSYWGISHYLARSGLHLALIVLFWQIFLRLLPINYFKKQLILLIFTIIYGILTISSVSFDRSFIMIILYIICNLINIPIDSLHIICLTCFYILIENPYSIILVDFQLSFYITFILLLLNELKIKNTNNINIKSKK